MDPLRRATVCLDWPILPMYARCFLSKQDPRPFDPEEEACLPWKSHGSLGNKTIRDQSASAKIPSRRGRLAQQ